MNLAIDTPYGAFNISHNGALLASMDSIDWFIRLILFHIRYKDWGDICILCTLT